MPRRAYAIAALLFFSGLCALIYQVAWLRELRLVFGASTPATSAVLAVFMGGLGYGSLLLGKRAEAAERPLTFYAHLEAGIAITAAISPLLLVLARRAYIATGGSLALGTVGSTAVRLLLSALVLLPPTLLMGGTLPAAARAATGPDDLRRRSTALLYGVNTLGAVTGAVASNFLLLEVFGTRLTLWTGCGINLLVAVFARAYGRELPKIETSDDEDGEEQDDAAPKKTSAATGSYVLAAAAGTGFSFLLLELVWYRVLSPLLGGSSYTFGLILAVALLGIGIGGLVYTWWGQGRPFGFEAFAITCALEAFFVALPFALGDRVALMALFLRPMGTVGLVGHVMAWTAVCALVVLPASIVAGFQFPLLISLLGRARRAVGLDVARTYAFNTLGAIIGSIAGGFLLIPWLGALGAWALCVWVLIVLGVGALSLHHRRRWAPAMTVPVGLLVVTVVMLHGSTGPTAFWRHSPIGAGRADDYYKTRTKNDLEWHIRERRRGITWEADGRESTVALYTINDSSFLVNGKSDGAAVADAGTQVMGGLLGALIHPRDLETALVIGLGTGSTAGWLGAVPSMKRVDTVELEPAILHVAKHCAAVNESVLDNPKVTVTIADAREVLLTTPERYDLVFSEPSNPYRAGIASLFTREFYEAVSDRLTDDGMFLQWVQAYEIDAQSVRTIYATLGSVFPHIETWRTKRADLILVARRSAQPLNWAQLSARVTQEPYREALLHAWRVTSPEGVLAHFVAGPGLSQAIAEAEGELAVNTDDQNMLEFSIARALGRPQDFRVEQMMEVATERGEGFPRMVGAEGKVRFDRVFDAATSMHLAEGTFPQPPVNMKGDGPAKRRMQAKTMWTQDSPKAVIDNWARQPVKPTAPVELMVLADAFAQLGKAEQALPLIEALRALEPVEADAIEAKLRWAMDEPRAAWPPLLRAIEGYRAAPWANNKLMGSALPVARGIAEAVPELAATIHEALALPFAVDNMHYLRVQERLAISMLLPDPALCVANVAAMGSVYPWYEEALSTRVACYERAKHPALSDAQAEYRQFRLDAAVDFGAGLRPERPLLPLDLKRSGE